MYTCVTATSPVAAKLTWVCIRTNQSVLDPHSYIHTCMPTKDTGYVYPHIHVCMENQEGARALTCMYVYSTGALHAWHVYIWKESLTCVHVYMLNMYHTEQEPHMHVCMKALHACTYTCIHIKQEPLWRPPTVCKGQQRPCRSPRRYFVPEHGRGVSLRPAIRLQLHVRVVTWRLCLGAVTLRLCVGVVTWWLCVEVVIALFVIALFGRLYAWARFL